MKLNNFYNHIKIFLNTATNLLEDLLPYYKSIKIKSEIEEYFVPYSNQHSYS